jgi:hypothetical protein
VRVTDPADAPLRIVRLEPRPRAPGRRPDVRVEAVNRSGRAISFAIWVVDPPDRGNHPFSREIWYGRAQPQADGPYVAGEPEVAPAASIRFVIHGADLGGAELHLWQVAFTDGTGWESFADGPSHDHYSGRPWTPPAALPITVEHR